jgi:glycosyltransferase involved in cell wall biosynthesis
MNRRQYITRAINSCLAVETDLIKPYVLIIDGMSDDGTVELVKAKYLNDIRVNIIQQDRIGFQRTAYNSALLVDTEYAMFMYDDDVLSPYFYQMFEKMMELERPFVMGYGEMNNIDAIYNFDSLIGKFREYPKYHFILAYYGYPISGQFSDISMPVSPICCIVKTNYLKKWVHFSQDYANKSAIRHYFMLDQNIGPDLIIYLSSILEGPQTVLVADGIVAQFSVHPDSMSIGYGWEHLEAGYWLGKFWGLEEICHQGKKDVAARCAAYLLLVGYKILINMIFNKDRKWALGFFMELFKLKRLVLKQSLTIAVLKSCVVSIQNRLRK